MREMGGERKMVRAHATAREGKGLVVHAWIFSSQD